MSCKFRERLSQNIKWRVIRETQNWTLDSTDMCSCTRTFMSMYTCAHHIHTDILIQRSDYHCYLWLRQCGSQQYFNCHYSHSATCHAFKMLFFAELCLKVSYIHAVSKTSQNSKQNVFTEQLRTLEWNTQLWVVLNSSPLSASLTHPFVWKIIVLQVLKGWYYY